MDEPSPLHVVRQATWWILAAALVAGAVSWGVINAQATSYEATAVVQPQSGGGSVAEQDRALAGEVLLAEGGDVAAAAAAATEVADARQLRRSVEVRQSQGTGFLDIVAQARTAEGARRLAQAWADAYVQTRRARVQSGRQQDLQAVDSAVAERRQSLEDSGSPDAATGDRADVQSQIDALLELRRELLVDAVLAAPAGEVVIAAERPSSAANPNPAIWAPAAAALAALLAALLALVWSRFPGADAHPQAVDPLTPLDPPTPLDPATPLAETGRARGREASEQQPLPQARRRERAAAPMQMRSPGNGEVSDRHPLLG